MERKKLYTLRGSLQQNLKEQKRTREKKAIEALLRGYACGQERGPAGRSQCVEGAGGNSRHWQPEWQEPRDGKGWGRTGGAWTVCSKQPSNQVSWRRLHLIVRPHPDQQILKTATDAASRGPHVCLLHSRAGWAGASQAFTDSFPLHETPRVGLLLPSRPLHSRFGRNIRYLMAKKRSMRSSNK